MQISIETEGMITVPRGRVWHRIVGGDTPGIPLLVLHGGPSEFTCSGTLQQADLMSRLSEILVPTPLTCGRHDEAAPDTVEQFCRLIP